jgi:hypothetical protein
LNFHFNSKNAKSFGANNRQEGTQLEAIASRKNHDRLKSPRRAIEKI